MFRKTMRYLSTLQSLGCFQLKLNKIKGKHAPSYWIIFSKQGIFVSFTEVVEGGSHPSLLVTDRQNPIVRVGKTF